MYTPTHPSTPNNIIKHFKPIENITMTLHNQPQGHVEPMYLLVTSLFSWCWQFSLFLSVSQSASNGLEDNEEEEEDQHFLKSNFLFSPLFELCLHSLIERRNQSCIFLIVSLKTFFQSIFIWKAFIGYLRVLIKLLFLVNLYFLKRCDCCRNRGAVGGYS